MDYMDRYRDEINEAGKRSMRYKSDDVLDQSYKADHIAENDVDEVSYEDSELEDPKAADISKDGDISDYELKRGKAIQKAMKDQEVEENMELTNDMGKDNWVDDEGRHAKMKLEKTAGYAAKLSQMLGDMDQLPAWVQETIVKASDYMSTVYHYLDYEMSRSEDDLKQNMNNYITEAKKKLIDEAPEDELGAPTTKYPTPSMLAITLKNLGLNGKTRTIIEDMTNTYVSIYRHHVAILGGYNET